MSSPPSAFSSKFGPTAFLELAKDWLDNNSAGLTLADDQDAGASLALLLQEAYLDGRREEKDKLAYMPFSGGHPLIRELIQS